MSWIIVECTHGFFSSFSTILPNWTEIRHISSPYRSLFRPSSISVPSNCYLLYIQDLTYNISLSVINNCIFPHIYAVDFFNCPFHAMHRYTALYSTDKKSVIWSYSWVLSTSSQHECGNATKYRGSVLFSCTEVPCHSDFRYRTYRNIQMLTFDNTSTSCFSCLESMSSLSKRIEFVLEIRSNFG